MGEKRKRAISNVRDYYLNYFKSFLINFKFVLKSLAPKEVANKWAQAKSNKEKMKYSNMARGIR